MFCKECGRNISDSNVCPFCGTVHTKEEEQTFYSFSEYRDRIINESKYKRIDVVGKKSRAAAGILQLFCGCLGIGRFYMGYTTFGIMQIAASLLTCGIAGVVWGFADGVMILTGKVKYDGKGELLA
ncbi:MAG: TM2 domain-containing protein [Clostridia bacterium]|nr:TM2 domain-containing protein [Clostridia bacterium]